MPFAEPGSGRRCLRQWLARRIAQRQAFAQSRDDAGQKTLQDNRWEIHGLESGILLFGRYQRSEHSLYLQYFNVNIYKHLKDQPNMLRKTNKHHLRFPYLTTSSHFQFPGNSLSFYWCFPVPGWKKNLALDDTTKIFPIFQILIPSPEPFFFHYFYMARTLQALGFQLIH